MNRNELADRLESMVRGNGAVQIADILDAAAALREPVEGWRVDLADEAFDEARQRYPHAHDALLWLQVAIGPLGKVTDEDIAWAKGAYHRYEARTKAAPSGDEGEAK